MSCRASLQYHPLSSFTHPSIASTHIHEEKEGQTRPQQSKAAPTRVANSPRTTHNSSTTLSLSLSRSLACRDYSTPIEVLFLAPDSTTAITFSSAGAPSEASLEDKPSQNTDWVTKCVRRGDATKLKLAMMLRGGHPLTPATHRKEGKKAEKTAGELGASNEASE